MHNIKPICALNPPTLEFDEPFIMKSGTSSSAANSHILISATDLSEGSDQTVKFNNLLLSSTYDKMCVHSEKTGVEICQKKL